MPLPSALPASRVPAPNSAPPLGWGIIGTGSIAHTFADALRRHTHQVLAAVGSREQARADAFAQQFAVERAHGSYEALLADPAVQAVYVATPHSHHAEQALLAIAAGKPVLVEKSFTRNAGEARRVVQAARAAGVPLMEAMWTRFLPDLDVVRQLLADGVLGELELVTADHGIYFEFDPQHRLFAPALAGGAMLDLGVYPVSFSSFVLGRPGRMIARGTRAATGVDRQVSLILDDYPGRPSAHALLSTTLAARTPTTASISGSEARIELAGAFYVPQQVVLVARDGSRVASEVPPILGHEGLCYEAAHFARLVAEGRTESPLLGLDETVAIMETMDEALAQLP